VPPPEAYAASMLKGTDLGSSSSGPWIFFNSCRYHSCKILSKYVRIYNKLCITLNIVTYKLLRPGLIIVLRRQPNVQVMGFDPSIFLLQHKIQRYKQVNTKKLTRRQKDCIVPASGSCGRDHLPHSGAPMTFSVGSASFVLRWL
jgi:hypothetical protein